MQTYTIQIAGPWRKECKFLSFFLFRVFFEEPDEGLLFKLYSLREETSKSQEEPDHRDEISQEQLGEDAVVEVASVGRMSEDWVHSIRDQFMFLFFSEADQMRKIASARKESHYSQSFSHCCPCQPDPHQRMLHLLYPILTLYDNPKIFRVTKCYRNIKILAIV